jgi:hypothetical protein
MDKNRVVKPSLLILLALLLVACEGLSQTGVRTTSHQGMDGGELSVRINKANGSAVQDIEVEEGWPGLVMEVDVALSVGQGCFKIEPLGEDDQVTLVLEACDGQAISGHGQMKVDAFGDASYRATATEAEDVEYTITYTFR